MTAGPTGSTGQLVVGVARRRGRSLPYAATVRRELAWAVFGAFAVHNLEEALAAPAYF